MAVPNPPPLPENGGQIHLQPPAPTPVFMFAMNVSNTLTHFFLGAMSFSAFYFVNLFTISSSLTLHIYLCVVGYILLMSQAVLSLNAYTSWTSMFRYENKKIIHWLMQFTGSILAIAGSIVRIVDMENNFTTVHGILGFMAMILTFLSLIGGVINAFSMKTGFNINIMRIMHSGLGSLTLCVAYLALCFGFSDLYRNLLGDTNANLSIALTVLALAGTLNAAWINMFKRILS